MQLSGRGKEVCGRSIGKNNGLESWWWSVETEKKQPKKSRIGADFMRTLIPMKVRKTLPAELQLPGIGKQRI